MRSWPDVLSLYLDNQRSIGPNSKFGQRSRSGGSKQEIGLNENLAREILELHTLGVAGGYTQRDVTTFAQVITGWSIGATGNHGRLSGGTPGTFQFRDAVHEPGKKTILNKTYKNTGVKQGEAVLRDLATNSATAKHLATKLVRHFVGDDPPPDLVSKIARIFLDSGGDLPTVHAALVNSNAAWRSTFGKYKSPQDFVISTLRALRRVPVDIHRTRYDGTNSFSARHWVIIRNWRFPGRKVSCRALRYCWPRPNSSGDEW